MNAPADGYIQEQVHADAMLPGSSKPTSFRQLAIAFISLALVIGLAGLLLFRHQEYKIRQDAIARLTAIVELKVGQIETWLRTKHAEARLLMTSLPADGVERWLATGDAAIQEAIGKRLEAFRAAFDSRGLFLLDQQGQLRLTVGKAPQTDPAWRQLVEKVWREQQPHFGDIRRDHDDPDGLIHLDFLVPVLAQAGNVFRTIGVLVVRHDPQRYLFPLLQTWPVPSVSSETLLVRRENNEAVYLNDLRHLGNTALKPRLPLDRREVPAVQALLSRDHKGVFEGRDYRRVPVLAVSRPIAGVSWVMLAKTDLSEVYGGTHDVLVLVLTLSLLAVGAAGVFTCFLWRQQKAFHALRSHQQATERQALVKHFEYLSRFANDIVLLLDEDLRIVEANDRALEAYGRSRRELLGLEGARLRIPEARADLKTTYEQLEREGRALYQTWHLRKDGSRFPVEISARSIEVAGKHFSQTIIRDITERKRYERALVETEAKFRGLVEQSIAGIFITDGVRLRYANPRFAEIFGYQPEDMRQLDIKRLIAETDHDAILGCIQQHLHGAEGGFQATFMAIRKDGTPIDVGMHGTRALYEDSPAIIGIAQDISERKRAEEKINHYVERLERAMLSTVEAVSMMSELRDPYTSGHEHRVGHLAAAIAQEMGLAEETVQGLRIIGTVHDIGKITIPAEILSKPGRLSQVEFELIKTHSQQGYEILKRAEFPWPVARTILQHHERLDGSGYPHGLKGAEIALEARVIAVADVVEAISSHRPYRPSRGVDEGLREIIQYSGVRYDADAVAACVRLFQDKGFQFMPPHAAGS